ncbi:DUF1294 domain-containing protein [Deinococcus sonorensis]|uniref:DUF1294 domain-containing protein n=2 Tax=Deinococcus sonorensis TaxID=309891 RepID=A0AAU7UA49_9DEIO
MTLLRLLAVLYIAMSLVAFVAVWQDKQLARGGHQRIPERQLHRLEAWFGWPGSLLAQQVFRHKTRKVSYQRVFRRVVALHLGGLAVLLVIWYVSGRYNFHVLG